MNYYRDCNCHTTTQQGQGKSNIMFSSSISIGDAIKAASQLKSELKIAQLDLEIGSSKNITSEEQILHTAANILRRDIHSLDLNNDYYPTPSECSLPLSIQSMPPNLTKFISCIGKLWADGGLRDLMVDSGVYAGCTVDQMLLGKQFNRSVRGLTLVYEALRSLWFASFFKWCEENDGIDAIPKDVWVMLSKCQAKFSDESESYKDELRELTILYSTHVLP
ncbi:Hypothetical predicted protein [Mytilus galloprovincialis]|uniref:Uncharacterized protein n=1 Tax=Mytilus galloprovincialis TaxID=29158 RepID=A0A8B6DL07_MYTGA|nr:Hypothetical predicted protein [Mytilus galloprovincialis]